MSAVDSDIAKRWGDEWLESPDGRIDLRDHRERYKYAILQKLLDRLPKNTRVTEIGCGNSAWLRLLKEKNPDTELYGLDISKDAVEISKKHGVQAVLGDARKMPFDDNFFDLVFSFGTVEHFPETEQAILEHIRILKRGGYAWIETPNKLSPQGFEAAFSNWRHKRDKYQLMIEQGKWYSHWDLKRMANKAPYKIEIKIQGSGPVVPYYRFFGWLDSIFPNVIRRFFGGNAGIIVKKLT